MSQTEQWPSDLEILKETRGIPTKKLAPDPVASQNEKIKKLEKRIDMLDRTVHNLRVIVEQQILNIKKLNKNLKQESHDRVYGNSRRQKTVSQ